MKAPSCESVARRAATSRRTTNRVFLTHVNPDVPVHGLSSLRCAGRMAHRCFVSCCEGGTHPCVAFVCRARPRFFATGVVEAGGRGPTLWLRFGHAKDRSDVRTIRLLIFLMGKIRVNHQWQAEPRLPVSPTPARTGVILNGTAAGPARLVPEMLFCRARVAAPHVPQKRVLSDEKASAELIRVKARERRGRALGPDGRGRMAERVQAHLRALPATRLGAGQATRPGGAAFACELGTCTTTLMAGGAILA